MTFGWCDYIMTDGNNKSVGACTEHIFCHPEGAYFRPTVLRGLKIALLFPWLCVLLDEENRLLVFQKLFLYTA